MVSSPSSPESGGPAGGIRPPEHPATPPPLPNSVAVNGGAPLRKIAINGPNSFNRASPTSPSAGLPQTQNGQPAVARPVVNEQGRPSPDPAASAGLLSLVGSSLALGNFWQQVPSWLLSSVFHLTFILILASYSAVGGLHSQSGSGSLATVTGGGGDSDGPGLDDASLDPVVESAPAGNKLNDVLQPTTTASLGGESLESSAALLPTAPDIASPLSALSVPVGGTGVGGVDGGGASPNGDLLGGIGNSVANSLQSRLSAANRAHLVGSGGGTLASEDAVAHGLQWLSEHQRSDGSWSFAHQSAPRCAGRCDHPGRQDHAIIASTALGLLPFLGAGETHQQGRYKRNVDMALHFLGRAMHQLGGNGGMWEPGGRMYGHGLAAIALCEAYGMTRDSALEHAAQKSVDFIVEVQDPIGGGWRYFVDPPRRSGDTSVVGWQMMALKSANMAYLKVPSDTIRKAGYFLDSVQQDEGSMYGYVAPGDGAATSAIGLLCRMYMGWQHDRPALVRGVTILSEKGPSLGDSGPPRNNMYYNYYGTQVLHHYGGYEWIKWNAAMRDYLIATQSKAGHEAGSWFFEGTDYGSTAGGRLYCTAMATMILEVYYRHLPLYTNLSTKDQFK